MVSVSPPNHHKVFLYIGDIDVVFVVVLHYLYLAFRILGMDSVYDIFQYLSGKNLDNLIILDYRNIKNLIYDCLFHNRYIFVDFSAIYTAFPVAFCTSSIMNFFSALLSLDVCNSIIAFVSERSLALRVLIHLSSDI